jgi:deazaflavin-dependent oxidoreductase (nitroreductase family)
MNTKNTTLATRGPRSGGPGRRLVKAFGPISSPIAGTRWFPLWAILRHAGRTSGKAYATPVVALTTPDGFVIPLPFGDATQWAKNLFAAGGGTLRHAGREYGIDQPEIVDLKAASVHLPGFTRFMAGRLGIRQWVLVRLVSS